MAKRTEVIQTNCENCGCGLQIDLNDLSVILIGDTAKPVAKSEVDTAENEKPNSEKGVEKDNDGSSGESGTDVETGDDGAGSDKPDEVDEGFGSW